MPTPGLQAVIYMCTCSVLRILCLCAVVVWCTIARLDVRLSALVRLIWIHTVIAASVAVYNTKQNGVE